MFLKELQEESQKTLFLELTALIMMAEGDSKTTSQKIQKLEPQSKRYALIPKLETESKKFECLKRLDSEGKRYIFLQNISGDEINALDAYAEELEIRNTNSLFSLNSRNSQFKLMTVLEAQTALVLNKCEHLDGFKEKLILSTTSSDEDILNIDTEVVRNSTLTISSVKSYILRHTAEELVSIRQASIGHFSSKEKKIMLFELIGAGYSSGVFGNDEKALLIYICELLNIENEYIEEFLEVTERLFAINKDIAILINE